MKQMEFYAAQQKRSHDFQNHETLLFIYKILYII